VGKTSLFLLLQDTDSNYVPNTHSNPSFALSSDDLYLDNNGTLYINVSGIEFLTRTGTGYGEYTSATPFSTEGVAHS
jgi:hypothetical protein